MVDDLALHEDNSVLKELHFSVVEDVAAELEDFIYLARLGCSEAANDIYQNVLKRHAPHSYPILAAYIEMLLDNHDSSSALELLEKISLEPFSPSEKQCLKLFKLLSVCQIDRSNVWHKDAPIWVSQEFDFTLNDILDYKPNGMIIDARTIDHVEIHIKEISISLYLLVNKDVKRTDTALFFKNLPVIEDNQVPECCLMLIENERYWEAYKFLLCAIRIGSLETTGFHEDFLRNLCYHQPSHARSVVELAVVVDYLEHLVAEMVKSSTLSRTASRQIIATAAAAETFFDVFFEDDSTCRGSRDSQMQKAIEIWLKLCQSSTQAQFHEVQEDLVDALNEGVMLPRQLRELANLTKNSHTFKKIKSEFEENASSSLSKVENWLGIIKGPNFVFASSDTQSSDTQKIPRAPEGSQTTVSYAKSQSSDGLSHDGSQTSLSIQKHGVSKPSFGPVMSIPPLGASEGDNMIVVGTLTSIVANLEEHIRIVQELPMDSNQLKDRLRTVKSSFDGLLRALRDPRNLHNIRFYFRAIDVAVRSLLQMLTDIDMHVKQYLGNDPTVFAAHRAAWDNLSEFVAERLDLTLSIWLEKFSKFIDELSSILEGGPEIQGFGSSYKNVENLLLALHERTEKARIDNPDSLTTVEDHVLTSPSKLSQIDLVSTESVSQLVFDNTLLEQHTSGEPLRPKSPPPPPPVTVQTSSEPVNLGSSHWLKPVFTMSRPTTSFSNTLAESCLFGGHMSGVTDTLRKKEYNERLILLFDNSIEVRIYVRVKDLKARLYCKFVGDGRRIVSCRAISSIYIHRRLSNLEIYEFDKANKRRIWLILKFPTYEKMILFFCSFLSLKTEDRSMIKKPDKHILSGEKHVFSCTIYDDYYRHALQIFKDTSSDGMRLQASVLQGEGKTMPVWTAFINYKISAVKWIKRVDAHKVYLTDLPRYIFRSDYTPHFGPNGECEIVFDEVEDVDRFVQIIDDLAEGRV